VSLLDLLVAFIRRRPATWTFHALSLGIAVAILGSVLIVQEAARDRLQRDLAGVDLVIGAEGSALQLIASTLLQADAPTGNIPLAEAERIAASPLVETAIPMSLGDNVAGARIVGTSLDYPALYGAELATGRWWSEPMEAVLGAGVARRLGLGLGDTFAGEHGLSPGGAAHADRPYRVVGVLTPSGSVIDHLVLTDIASVWALHEEDGHDHGNEAHTGHSHDPPPQEAGEERREITALLIRYRSPLAAVLLPRSVADIPNLQAASPAREAQRLAAIFGRAGDMMWMLGAALGGLAVVGFVISLLGAVSARRNEAALLRALGFSRRRLALLSLLEGAALGASGGVAGVMLARVIASAVAGVAPAGQPLLLPAPGLTELWLVGGAIILGALAAAAPAMVAARTNVAEALRVR